METDGVQLHFTDGGGQKIKSGLMDGLANIIGKDASPFPAVGSVLRS